ncbi:M1 family metallopeptidase [Flexivirga oryzae]|uniref:Aminopeptidase N n=1 Tax=Flexivirga oryzae TaxID=1794944 RepID=A0A839NAJ4_9MICO|nr:M1 family metallopeptidase [Flexivirga oryzae]MBB2893859.1 aminopeptidase N [Flexivirga oryzae]
MRKPVIVVATTVSAALIAACQSGSDAATPTGSTGQPQPRSSAASTPTGSTGSSGSDAADSNPPGKPGVSYRAALSHPVKDSYYPKHGTPYLDTLHYGLDLDWRPRAKRLTGIATIRFRITTARDSVRFALGTPLHVSKVVLDGKRVSSTRSGNSVTIQTGPLTTNSRHTVAISYAGTPALTQEPAMRSDVQKDGFHIGRTGNTWTFQEPFGAFTWYPVNDQPSDKAYYDARLTAHRGQQGVFNGQLTSSVKTGDSTTNSFHLDKPASSYLTTVAFGRYTHQEVTGPHGLPVNYWYADRHSPMLPLIRKTPQMLSWIEKTLGPYPFASAGFLLVPGNSGMETQTLVTFSDQLSKPDLYETEGDVVHELIHQWFGDEITPTDWKDVWLNESLTMYLEYRYLIDRGYTTESKVYGRLQRGQDEVWRVMGGPPGAYRHDDFGDMNIYDCGALLLHNLEKAYGRAKLDAALKGWPATAKYGNSDRTKFAAYMSKALESKAGPYILHWLTAKTTPAPLPKQP